MQLTELSDYFRAQYEAQSLLRRLPVVKWQETVVAAWMAEGMMEIQRKLHVLQMEYTLVCNGTSTSYLLPTNFGRLLQVYVPNSATDPSPSATQIPYKIINRLEFEHEVWEGEAYAVTTFADTYGYWISFSQAPAAGNLTLLFELSTGINSPSASNGQIATFSVDGSGNLTQSGADPSTLVLTPSSEVSGTYVPSGGLVQPWGYYDGTRYLGNVQLPDIYLPAIVSYMLGKVFPEYLDMRSTSLDSFPNRLHSLQVLPTTRISAFKYNFAGKKQ